MRRIDTTLADSERLFRCSFGSTPVGLLLASQLYGVAPHDVATLGVSLVVVLAAGGLACDLPARRAVRLDTAAALRNE